MPKDEKVQKDIDSKHLTEYDVCELFIRCVEVCMTACSKADIEKHIALQHGRNLWKETLEALKEYRKGNP